MIGKKKISIGSIPDHLCTHTHTPTVRCPCSEIIPQQRADTERCNPFPAGQHGGQYLIVILTQMLVS